MQVLMGLICNKNLPKHATINKIPSIEISIKRYSKKRYSGGRLRIWCASDNDPVQHLDDLADSIIIKHIHDADSKPSLSSY